ncbi:hypothetical protein DMP17_44395 [Pseudonocardia sp. TMWB2A]|uniref:hypothetical protein n=1 Tax=Pseudonocardia sp. TMWB2A TaxID=687430 RepID=UPI00307E509F
MSALLRNANDPSGPLAGISIDIERSAWLAASSPMPFTCLTPAVATPAAANCALETDEDCPDMSEDSSSTVVG